MHIYVCVCVKSLQLCPTLCDVTLWTVVCKVCCSQELPGKNTSVGCCALPQGSFPTQELNLHLLWLLHCRQILYHWATGEAHTYIHTYIYGKLSACNAVDPGLIPVLGRSPGEGNANPLQYSCLKNPMDRGAWWARVHGIARVGHNLVTKLPPHIYTHTYSYIQTHTLTHKHIHKMWCENCFPPSICFSLAGGKTQLLKGVFQLACLPKQTT